MINNNYYRNNRYSTGTSATDCSTASFPICDSTVSSVRPTTAIEYELNALKREHSALKQEYKTLKRTSSSLKDVNSVLHKTLDDLENKHNLFLEAISFHVDINKITSTIKQLVKARSNSIEFEKLLDEEIDYLFEKK